VIRAPQGFDAPPLRADRIAVRDLAFVQGLMTRPEMNAHKPDPTPPDPDRIAATHARDVALWDTAGHGRYVLRHGGVAVGLCGFSLRPGYPGLNLSYHIAPEHWGRGWASAVVAAMVEVARALDLPDAARMLHALVRPANPASARVLVKAGFRQAGTRSLGGAPTELFLRDLR